MPTTRKYDALTAGLRANRRVPINTFGWSQFQNLRATRYGAVDFHAIPAILDGPTLAGLGSVVWPFPQVFIGRSISLLCFETAIYYVDATGVHALSLYNAHEIDDAVPTTRTIPAGGGPWQFVDFWDTWLLFNGASTIFRAGFDTKTWIVTSDHESLTNGGFDGSATGWNLGAGWTYDTGGIVHTPGSSNAAYQPRASMVSGKGVDEDFEYEITITVESMTAGELAVWLGNPPDTIAEDGTYVFLHVCSATERLSLNPDSDFDGKVTAVSVRKTGALVRTGANWNDARVVLAGFDETNFYNMVDWPTEVTTARTSAPAEIQAKLTALGRNGCGAKWAFWSSIGGEDMLRLWSLKALKFGSFSATPTMGYSSDTPLYMDLLYRNEFGYAPMPYAGAIVAASQLGPHMALYGAESGGRAGAALLVGTDRIGIEDVRGLGLGVGVANRGAVAGAKDRHILVDQTGGLWQITPDGPGARAEFLDRQEYLGTLDLAAVRVVHEPYHDEFYIGDGTDAYILSEDGELSAAPWMPSSATFISGLTGITFATSEPDEIVLESLPFNAVVFGGQAGQPFSIQRVRAETTDIDSTGWTVEIGMRVKQGDSFHWFTATALNAAGVADGEITGVEAAIRLTHPDRTKTTGLAGLYIDANLEGPFNTEAWLSVTQTPASIP